MNALSPVFADGNQTCHLKCFQGSKESMCIVGHTNLPVPSNCFFFLGKKKKSIKHHLELI